MIHCVNCIIRTLSQLFYRLNKLMTWFDMKASAPLVLSHAKVSCLTLTCLWSRFQEMPSQHAVAQLYIMAPNASSSLLIQHLATPVRSAILAWSRKRNEYLPNHAVQPQCKDIIMAEKIGILDVPLCLIVPKCHQLSSIRLHF